MTRKRQGEADLVGIVRDLRIASQREVDSDLRGLGMTTSMGLALRVLKENDGISQCDLAALLGVTQPTMATIVSGLVKRRFVRVEKDVNDRRRHRVQLTAAGTKGAAAMEAAEAKAAQKLMQGVGEQDLAVAIRVMEHILENIAAGSSKGDDHLAEDIKEQDV